MNDIDFPTPDALREDVRATLSDEDVETLRDRITESFGASELIFIPTSLIKSRPSAVVTFLGGFGWDCEIETDQHNESYYRVTPQ